MSLATDNHVGFMEKDPVRGGDSLESFKEVLTIAKDKDVSMIGITCSGLVALVALSTMPLVTPMLCVLRESLQSTVLGNEYVLLLIGFFV